MDKKVLYRHGIDNLGNTCYFNTAIQCLITKLVIYASNLTNKSDSISTNAHFMRWLIEFDYSKEKIVDLFTNPLYANFNKYYKIGQTFDSFDCLQKLIDLISMESTMFNTLFAYKYASKCVCKCGNIKIFNGGKPIISNAVYITRAKFISCFSDNNDKNAEENMGFQLIDKVFNSKDETDIKCDSNKCSSGFTTSDKSTGGKYMIEQHTTENIPRILIIRFLDTHIPCKSIPLQKFSISQYTYLPVSVAYHTTGKPGGGHYKAIVLRRDTPNSDNMYYYSIDDEQVTKVTWPFLEVGTSYVVYEANDKK